MSIDCYTKADPRRIFDLAGNLADDLGESSAYHHRSGVYRDAVSPELPSLPDHWHERLIKVERAGARACFLEPNDAALSKYVRGEPRDRQWIKAGLLAGVVSMPVVKSRLGTTNFTDHDEESKARKLVGEDRLWFRVIQDQRKLTV